MALTKETAVKIYKLLLAELNYVTSLRKDVTDLIERQKVQDEKRDEPISVNSYTRFGRDCRMGITENSMTASMRIFDISHELALLVVNEHSKKLVQDLEELQQIAVREQAADFSRNARLFKLLGDKKFQWKMKGCFFVLYSNGERTYRQTCRPDWLYMGMGIQHI